MSGLAEGVVVGSAIISCIDSLAAKPAADRAAGLQEFVRSLVTAMVFVLQFFFLALSFSLLAKHTSDTLFNSHEVYPYFTMTYVSCFPSKQAHYTIPAGAPRPFVAVHHLFHRCSASAARHIQPKLRRFWRPLHP